MAQVLPELALGEEGDKAGHGERHRKKPKCDDQHGVQAKRGRDQRVHLGQAHGGDGDENLVEGVHERPAHHHVSDHAVDHHDAQRGESDHDPARGRFARRPREWSSRAVALLTRRGTSRRTTSLAGSKFRMSAPFRL